MRASATLWRGTAGLLLALLIAMALAPSVAYAQDFDAATPDGFDDPSVAGIALGSFETQTDLTGGMTRQFTTPPHLHARYLRIDLSEVTLAAGDSISIWGNDATATNGNNRQVIQGPLPPHTAVQSHLIQGGLANITVSGPNLAQDQLTIARIFYESPPKAPWTSIFGSNDIIDLRQVADDAPLVAAARAVVFLSFTDQHAIYMCTGFLINAADVVTNNHCVNNAAECASATFVFDYLSDQDNGIRLGVQRQCASVLATDYGLDVSVLKMDGPAPPGVVPLPLQIADVAPGAQEYLVQHPDGFPKEVAIKGCWPVTNGVPGRSVTDAKTDLSHRCGTIGGSSGSPLLFNADLDHKSEYYCVNALHHWGFSASGQYSSLNRAVRMLNIVPFLQTHNIEIVECQPQR